MSFTNQKPFTVEEKDLRGFTRGKSRRFNCAICGELFAIGSIARWVYANGVDGPNCGNFFVCQKCDAPNILEVARESYSQARKLAMQWGIYGPDWQ